MKADVTYSPISQLTEYILLSVVVASRICVTLAQATPVNVFSGDTIYGPILPEKLTGKTVYPSVVGNPNLKALYGTIFNQFGSNMTMLDCTSIGIDQPVDKTKQIDMAQINWNTTCLLGPVDATSTSYQVAVFTVTYPVSGPASTSPPTQTWHKSAVTNLTLPAGKNYVLYPSDLSSFLYIAATEYAPSTNKSTLWFVQLKFNGDNQPMLIQKDLAASPVMVAGNFQLLNYSKLLSSFKDAVVLFNTLNSTMDYEGANAQPPNNNLLVLQLSSGKAYLSNLQVTFANGTTRPMQYLLDVESSSDHLYFVGLDKDGTNPLRAVLGCYQSTITSTEMTFAYSTPAAFYPIPLSEMSGSSRFYHLVSVRNTTADDSYHMLLANHSFDGNTQNKQKLSFNMVWMDKVWPNSQDIFFMRPAEPATEIRPSKLGMRNNQVNIRYLNGGKLSYIDLISSLLLNFTIEGDPLPLGDIFSLLKPVKKPTGITAEMVGLMLQRFSTGNLCEKAFAMFNKATDLFTYMHQKGQGHSLHCISNNVMVSSWGDKDNYNYQALVTASYPEDKLDNLTTTITFYDFMPSSTGQFSPGEQKQAVLVRSSPLYYPSMFPIAPEYNYTLTVARNSNQKLMGNVPIETNIAVGNNISVVPIQTYPNVRIVNQKFLPISILRTDTGNMVADEKWMASSFIVIEEIRKAIGVLSSVESLDYDNGAIVRKSSLVSSLPLTNGQISRSRDEIEECDSILILVLNKDNNTRTMVVFEKTGNKIYKIATTAGVRNQHIMGCSKSSFVFLAWDQNSPTNTMEEFVFNRKSKALVPTPNPTTGFGLKSIVNIRKGYMSKVDILFHTWNNATNILEIQAWKFNDATPTSPRFDQDPRIEYKYIPKSLVGNEVDISISSRHYVAFNADIKSATTVQGLQSEYFLGAQNFYYWEENVAFQTLALTQLIAVWPHKTKYASSYSIYGIQTLPSVSEPTNTVNYTIVATVLTGVDQRAKIYNVYNTTKTYTTARATDNNQEKIYFHFKEFAGQTDVYQLNLDTRGLVSAKFGAVEQSELNITLQAKNNVKSYDKIFIRVFFQSVSKIEVTNVSNLDYKPDTVLSLLPGMATSIKGSILKISLYDSSDSSVKMLNNRITGGTEVQIPSVSRVPDWAPRDSARTTGSSVFINDAIYVVEDGAFYLSRARSFLTTCKMDTKNLVSNSAIVETQSAASKLMVFYKIDDVPEIKSMIVDLSAGATPPTCGSPLPCKLQKPDNPPLTVDNPDKLSDMFVVAASPSSGLPASTHLIVLLGKGSQSTYYLSEESAGSFLYNPLVSPKFPETLDATPDKNPYEVPLDTKDCVYLQDDEVDKNPLMLIVCIIFEKEVSKGNTVRKLWFLTINIVFASGGKVYARPVPNPVPDTDALRKFYEDGIESTQCIIYDRNTISCAAFDTFGTFTQFFLTKPATGCADSLSFCVNLGPNRYKSVLHGSIPKVAGDITRDYVLTYGTKASDSFTGKEAITYLYKLGDTNTVYYSQPLGDIDPEKVFICQFFRDNSAPEINFILGANLTFRKYQIGELQLKFTAPDRASLKGMLNFSNADPTTNHYQLKLQDLFKVPVSNITNTPTTATQETNFFAKYWWACVAVGGLLISGVGFYFYRREMLIRAKNKLSDETIINHLEEFYYGKRA